MRLMQRQRGGISGVKTGTVRVALGRVVAPASRSKDTVLAEAGTSTPRQLPGLREGIVRPTCRRCPVAGCGHIGS